MNDKYDKIIRCDGEWEDRKHIGYACNNCGVSFGIDEEHKCKFTRVLFLNMAKGLFNIKWFIFYFLMTWALYFPEKTLSFQMVAIGLVLPATATILEYIHREAGCF